jgi:hypothetical protein
MKRNFARILAIVSVGLAAACVAASPASAQQIFKGSFTLPEQVRWANADLPAGDYTFTLGSQALPAEIVVTGPNGRCFVMTSSVDTKNTDESSNLKIERRGGARFIKELYLADLHLKLNYRAPSMPKNQELAKGPVSTEEILIATAK